MIRRNRTTALVVLILLLLAQITGCTRPSPHAKTLKVGALLSLTGGAAAYGGDADKGARLAMERLRETNPGLNIEYILQDDKSDKTEAAKVVRNLLDVNKVNVILGPAISPSALSIGKLAEERQIPVVGTSPTQDEVTLNSRYVTRVCFNDSFQGAILAHFLYESMKIKSAAIVYDKTLSYSIGLAKTFREVFTELGGTVKYEENYSVKDTDYAALINKVAKYDVEALFIPGWDENVGPMLYQAGHAWDKFVLLGGDAWPSNRLLELARGNIRNAYALSHYIAEDPDSMVQDFRALYRSKYNEEASPFAALGYDAMMLINDAARRAKSFSGPDLMTAILASDNVRLVSGTVSFDSNRNPRKDAVIVRIEQDSIRFYQRVRA